MPVGLRIFRRAGQSLPTAGAECVAGRASVDLYIVSNRRGELVGCKRPCNTNLPHKADVCSRCSNGSQRLQAEGYRRRRIDGLQVVRDVGVIVAVEPDGLDADFQELVYQRVGDSRPNIDDLDRVDQTEFVAVFVQVRDGLAAAPIPLAAADHDNVVRGGGCGVAIVDTVKADATVQQYAAIFGQQLIVQHAVVCREDDARFGVILVGIRECDLQLVELAAAVRVDDLDRLQQYLVVYYIGARLIGFCASRVRQRDRELPVTCPNRRWLPAPG